MNEPGAFGAFGHGPGATAWDEYAQFDQEGGEAPFMDDGPSSVPAAPPMAPAVEVQLPSTQWVAPSALEQGPVQPMALPAAQLAPAVREVIDQNRRWEQMNVEAKAAASRQAVLPSQPFIPAGPSDYAGLFDWLRRDKNESSTSSAGSVETAEQPQPEPSVVRYPNSQYKDLAQGTWVMAGGGNARIIRDTWVYAQWSNGDVTVLENETGDRVNKTYSAGSDAARQLELHWGTFAKPVGQQATASAAPQSAAQATQATTPAAQASTKGQGLVNVITALTPMVAAIWGPAPQPAPIATTTEESSSNLPLILGAGLALVVGGYFLFRNKPARAQE